VQDLCPISVSRRLFVEQLRKTSGGRPLADRMRKSLFFIYFGRLSRRQWAFSIMRHASFFG
jgi:hypothetical protein